MKDWSFIERLLDGTDVRWETLGKLADIGTGRSNRQDEQESGRYPFYVRSKNILRSNTYQFDETAIVIPGEGGIGDILHYVQGRYALHQRAYRVHVTSAILDSKFLYYFMSQAFKRYITQKNVGATAASIRKPMLTGFPVPIPCSDDPAKSLAIQAEIVRILDTFTELASKLTTELTAREKQYNYYRERLLQFEEGEAQWTTLGEAFDITVGGDVPKEAFADSRSDEFSVPILSNGIGNKALYGWTNRAKVEKPSLTVSARGTIGWTSFRVKPFYPIVRLLVLTPKVNFNLRYAYHFMKTIENDYRVSRSGIPQLTSPMIQGIKIPFPGIDSPASSLAEQTRIVSILDQFDTLTSSFSEGLPREIELRQKQYEYYRDLLLDFPRPEVTD